MTPGSHRGAPETEINSSTETMGPMRTRECSKAIVTSPGAARPLTSRHGKGCDWRAVGKRQENDENATRLN